MRSTAEILHSLKNLTRLRDREVLHVGLVMILQDLLRPLRVGYFELLPESRKLLTRVAMEGEDIHYLPPELLAVESAVPTSSMPSIWDALIETPEAALNQPGPSYVLPVVADGHVVALIELEMTTSLAFHVLETVVQILGVFGNHLALLDYSEKDSLTGLLNRKTFDSCFSRLMINRQSPPDQPGRGLRKPTRTDLYWLGVIDIDHFKQVNDRLGHLYGDEVLILIARLMRQFFRDRDQLYRFGGEEFVVVLQPTQPEHVRNVFERFRVAVSEYFFPQLDQLTVSIGFAPIDLKSSASDILGRADEALYWAKDAGRNQVASYEELLAAGGLKAKSLSDSVELF